MTNGRRYTVPRGVPAPDAGRVVLLDREPGSVVERMGSVGADQLEGVHLVGLPDDLDPLYLIPSHVPLVIEIRAADAPRLARQRRPLRRLQAHIAIPSGAGVFRATNITTALGLTARLMPFDTTAAASSELMRIARLYLMSPHVRVAIEPLHTITMGLIRGLGEPDLFELYRERVGFDTFLESRTSAAPSPRWLRTPEGDIRPVDEPDGIALDRRLRSLDRTFPESCEGCASVPLCGGYLTTCRGGCSDGWRAMFDHLAAAAAEIRSTTAVEGVREAIGFVSTRCNNRCIFCAPGDALRDIDRDEILNFIRGAARAGVRELALSGAGEPTLAPELAEYVSFARQSGIDHVTVFTNGSHPNLVTKLVEAGTSGFLLSIHGFEATHDAVVGRAGRFRKAHQTLLAIQRTGTPVTVNTVLSRRVLPEISAFCDWIANRSVVRHYLAFPEWSGRALSNPAALPTYAEVRGALASRCWDDVRHVRFDNLPDCVADTGLHRRDNHGTLLYFDQRGTSRLDTSDNLGKNTRPGFCRDLRCARFGSCSGLDRNYLAYHGQDDVEAIARRWLADGENGDE